MWLEPQALGSKRIDISTRLGIEVSGVVFYQELTLSNPPPTLQWWEFWVEARYEGLLDAPLRGVSPYSGTTSTSPSQDISRFSEFNILCCFLGLDY